MNYYVFRQILISLILKIFRHHGKPGLPYGQFSYVLPYSWKQNLFLKFHFLSWSHDLNLNYYFLILSLILLNHCWILIFLILTIFLHEKPHLPYGQFSYVLPYSWKQNLFLKFRFRNLKKIFLFLMSQIWS